MNKYHQRKRNLYDPKSKIPFVVSRSKINLFLECPRCFYLDRKLGLGRPSMPGWSLNSAVDALLKNEFDLLRKQGQAHELMKQYKIDAIPFDHPDLPMWRGDIIPFSGAKVLHKQTNLIIDGLIDDVWQDKKGNLLIVDYKSTSTSKELSLDDEYKQGYKKQMEVYQWIFRQLRFKVSSTGYFVFANAGKNREKFDGRLEFAMSILTYEGNDSWVEPVIFEIKKTLNSIFMPKSGGECEYCKYRELVKRR